MFKKIIFIFFIFLSCFSFVNATEVEVSTFVYSDSIVYSYILEFDNQINQSIFSFKVPSNSTIDYAVDERDSVKYNLIGERYYFYPNVLKDNTILVKFKSKVDLNNSNEFFKTHLDFDFFVDNLNMKIFLKEDFKEVVDVFPRNYLEENNKITWNQQNVSETLVYIVNFKEKIKEEVVEEKINSYFYLWFVIGFVLIVFLLIGVYFKYYRKKITKELLKSIKKSNIVDNRNIEVNVDNGVEVILKDEIIDSNKNNEKNKLEKENNIIKEDKDFDEEFFKIIDKHLTEKEQEVVTIVRENDGILQNEILNFLPKLTKSNLSKIISKLDALKYLNRIKVGKVNKIFLGEKLIFEEKVE